MGQRAKRILCHDCGRVLVTEDRHHYVYQCHACVVDEHELILLSRREPGHPDLVRLAGVPVEIAFRKIDSESPLA